MGKILNQLSAIWSRLEASQRITIVLVAIGLAIGAVALGYGASRPDYRLLASGLTPAKVAKIAGELEQANTPYRVSDGETAILVPSKDLYRLRNVLAESGTLTDDDGFKLLDRGRMWDSTFIEHKNYDRAVSSELEAGFREIPGVANARVIDRPPPSPFVGEEGSQPKASIKLDMVPGMRLSPRQISGIVHLSSGAVAGLSPERVQVMDSAGILTPPTSDTGAAQAQTTMDAEVAREAHLTRKAQDLLDTVLGPGRSQVKVSVKLDFTKRSEASSEPGKQVALKENVTESDEKTPIMAGGGLVGTAPNVEGENGSVAGASQIGSKTTSETKSEFVVGQKTVKQEDEVGRIKAMSVSIVLDFKVAKVPKLDAAGKPTGETEERPEERSEAEKNRLRDLVLNAIGFDSAKGMQLKDEPANIVESRFPKPVVQSMEFTREADSRTVAEASVAPLGLSAAREWAAFALPALVAIGFLMVARGQLKRGAKRFAAAAETNAAATSRADAAGGDEAQRKRRQELKDAIKKKVQDDPAAAAQILKKWMSEG